MKSVKKLSIECVNKVKLETVEEFQNSIFSDVYKCPYADRAYHGCGRYAGNRQ